MRTKYHFKPGGYQPVGSATVHVLNATTEAVRGGILRFNSGDQLSQTVYTLLGDSLKRGLDEEINTATSGLTFGTGKQTGNGYTKSTPQQDRVSVEWIGRNILYLEYGAGKEAVEHPYAGGEMVDGYAPVSHGWVEPYKKTYTEGWEPLAPFYKFVLKTTANPDAYVGDLKKIIQQTIMSGKGRRQLFSRIENATARVQGTRIIFNI